jgi:hypothetical protein
MRPVGDELGPQWLSDRSQQKLAEHAPSWVWPGARLCLTGAARHNQAAPLTPAAVLIRQLPCTENSQQPECVSSR